MHTNLLDETPIELSEARRRYIPLRNGKPIAPSTIMRWIHAGIRAGDGSVVRLEAIKAGKALTTTPAAIRRFFSTLTERSTFAVANSSAAEPRERPLQELKDRNLI